MNGLPASPAPVGAASAPGGIEPLLVQNRRWVLLAIVVLSVTVRVAYFGEQMHKPYGVSAKFANTDMRFFDSWARHIARGNWLGSVPLHPLHDWHEQVAAIHFREHGRPVPGDPRASAQMLWNEWYGGTRFHQEPLYPYAIAATYRLLGAEPRAVYWLQMLLGVLSNLLLYFVARRSFSETVGVVAAAMAIFCGPLLFYETVLLRSSAITFLGLLTVYVTQEALDRGSRRGLVLAGLCAGLATMLKSTLVLLGLAAVALVIWQERGQPRLALARAALLVGGMAAALFPVAVRNTIVDAPVFSSSSVGAVTFLGANFDGTDSGRGFQLSLDEAAEILDRTEGRIWPTVVQTLRTHPHLGSWLALCVRKLGAAWHGYEIPNNVNFYLCRQDSLVLRLLPVTFTWIGPLALAGLIAAAWMRRGTVMLYALVLAHLAPLLVFYVLSRFRAPLLAALIPFAAAAVVWIAGWLRERRWRPVLVFGGVALVALLWSASPRPARADPEIRLADVAMVIRHWYLPESQRALDTGDAETAARLLADALRLEPASIEELLRGTRRPGPYDREALEGFADLYVRASRAHRSAGNETEAERLLERGHALRRRAREIRAGLSP